MKAVLFAAGKSTRTYPLTLTKPKPLLKVANKTIIEHNLEQLDGFIDEAIIITGYRGEMIRERLGEKFGKISLKYIEQKEQDGNGRALLLAKDILDKFIVMNSDDLFFREDLAKCIKHKYCVLAKEVSDISRFGEVITENNKVADLREKPPEKRSGLANTGLIVLDKEVFSHELKKSKRGEYEVVDFVKYLVEKGEAVSCEIAQAWIPISYPWNVLEANEHILSGMKGADHGTIEKGATVKGEVFIGKGTLVRAGSYIEGPAVIGDSCVIGPNCFIRGKSSVGNNSKIGNAVEVKNSVVGENTSIGHLSYVGDCVIGDNVNFGAGTITANLRHDNLNVKSPVKGEMVDSQRRKLGAIIGDGVHTGINTSIYPGRKIFPGKYTLPGEIVKKDIE
jgi:UDP-N-acetylglucosamine diphosphorylase / glucose-1-phosphate thymidylyltransferase / UDP-N-acetylgalactosamine diphosphorylase / glucosamine-1-phosphate N-acetyltransferase / galactosamine-1-phosphate N-acetyltransferase